MEGPGFITIKHGDDEDFILNTWVPSHLLLQYCKKKLYGEEELEKHKNVKIDLIDTNGLIRDLPSNPYLYAHNLIDPRETYILIKVECKENEDDKYISMLHNVGKLYPKVKAKLDELSNYKVSGKVGTRWAKIKTISKLTGMVKTSARSKEGQDMYGSNKSIDKTDSLESTRSERGSKMKKKSSKEVVKKKSKS